MKPVKFKEQNVIYAEDHPIYQPLQALKIKSAEGQVISCWKLSLNEQIRIFFTGRIWVSLMSFNEPLTPFFLSTKKSDHFKVNKTL